MSAPAIYDPAKLHSSFKGIIFSGFGEGSFCKVSRAEEGWFTKVSADGKIARTRNANKLGRVEYTFLRTSQVNALLSAFLAAAESGGDDGGPLFIKDLLGTSMYEMPFAWIEKAPDVEFGKEDTEITYAFIGELKVFHGASRNVG